MLEGANTMEMPADVVKGYAVIHQVCARQLAGGFDERFEIPRCNMTYNRRLCHATFDYRLDESCQRSVKAGKLVRV